MKKDENSKVESKKKLVLRKESIRELDNVELLWAYGGGSVPPDGGVPSKG